MSREARDLFGQLLMKVRDDSIDDIRRTMSGHMKGLESQILRDRLDVFPEDRREDLLYLVRFALDGCLHYLLWSLEQSQTITINVETPTGVVTNLAQESDNFPGELYGEIGWLNRFSKEPSIWIKGGEHELRNPDSQ